MEIEAPTNPDSSKGSNFKSNNAISGDPQSTVQGAGPLAPAAPVPEQPLTAQVKAAAAVPGQLWPVTVPIYSDDRAADIVQRKMVP